MKAQKRKIEKIHHFPQKWQVKIAKEILQKNPHWLGTK